MTRRPVTGLGRGTVRRCSARGSIVLIVAAVAILSLSVAGRPAGAALLASGSAPATADVINDFGCASSSPNRLRCLGKMHAHRGGHGHVTPAITSAPTGYGPADLRDAYHLAGARSNGRTVAVVEAMDDPNAESDLAVYRAAYDLAPCTAANGCFAKVNQGGQSAPLPAADVGWSEEISLDLDMVSAICPDCHILLVEADSPSPADVAIAEDTAAATRGVVAISNSFGGAEDSMSRAADTHFNHPGVAITASSGDTGYGVNWPASSRYVTAVGGTTLSRADNARGWIETTWSGAGSGCSASEPKPWWQHDTGCANRTVADVAAVADPATGVAIYDTYNTCGSGVYCDELIRLGLAQGLDGWVQVGGTSVAAPIIAGVYALAGNTKSINGASYVYGHPSALFDIMSGTNGDCGTYLCTAGAGYDGPTGMGSPNGTGGF